MGHTVARVKIYNSHNYTKSIELSLLVDTDSTYTWVKQSRLLRLDIETIGRRKFKTIENRVIERDIGEAVIECMGRRATCIIVFAEESDNEVLGVTALENLGLEVDPITKQLREVEAILALHSFD